MEFRYLSAYRVQGITHKLDDPDIVLVDRTDLRTKAVLTGNLDPYIFLLDRQTALAVAMLSGMFGGSKGKGTDFNQRLQQEIEEIRKARRTNASNDGIVVIEISGECEATVKDSKRELDDFIICFDAINKDHVREQCRSTVTALLSSLCIATSQGYEIERIIDGPYLINEEGKVVHSFSPSFGAANLYVSRPITSEVIDATTHYFERLQAQKDLRDVARLFAQSLDRKTDGLRTFISAWAAMEILVNRVFREYEKTFVGDILSTSPTHGASRYFRRITEVMKDKYTLVDKFGVIASLLSGETSDTDVELFKHVKKVRDDLFHGYNVQETAFPNYELRSLLTKYFRSHVDHLQG